MISSILSTARIFTILLCMINILILPAGCTYINKILPATTDNTSNTDDSAQITLTENENEVTNKEKVNDIASQESANKEVAAVLIENKTASALYPVTHRGWAKSTAYLYVIDSTEKKNYFKDRYLNACHHNGQYNKWSRSDLKSLFFSPAIFIKNTVMLPINPAKVQIIDLYAEMMDKIQQHSEPADTIADVAATD